jgi:hypothetical protein
VPEDEAPYRPASRPYHRRFGYQYRRHAFDKLRAIDLPLREFQALLDGGDIIAEAEVGILAQKELVLVVQWVRPLHVAIVVDEAREEERIVTIYEPDPEEWTTDFRRRR